MFSLAPIRSEVSFIEKQNCLLAHTFACNPSSKLLIISKKLTQYQCGTELSFCVTTEGKSNYFWTAVRTHAVNSALTHFSMNENLIAQIWIDLTSRNITCALYSRSDTVVIDYYRMFKQQKLAWELFPRTARTHKATEAKKSSLIASLFKLVFLLLLLHYFVIIARGKQSFIVHFTKDFK